MSRARGHRCGLTFAVPLLLVLSLGFVPLLDQAFPVASLGHRKSHIREHFIIRVLNTTLVDDRCVTHSSPFQDQEQVTRRYCEVQRGHETLLIIVFSRAAPQAPRHIGAWVSGHLRDQCLGLLYCYPVSECNPETQCAVVNTAKTIPAGNPLSL